MKPTIVCLCGSTRFKHDFIAANRRETWLGRIVLTVGWFSHSEAVSTRPSSEEKQALDELHLRKIDLADEILVIDPPVFLCDQCGKPCGSSLPSDCCRATTTIGTYIGESTAREIQYAKAQGKPIRYLSKESELQRDKGPG